MITRWNLGLSLTLALTVVAGAFSLLWERTNALQATQIELATRMSRVEAQVEAVQEDVAALRVELRESVADLRGEMRDLREEMRDLRGEIRELGDLIRARETREPSGVGAQ
ncbi:hypothetical protein [Candidatus Palauibacter sp.]|uniref:hypothetical protein n=1 Tax=Candidatus Palauibacter sp. TaxID=3101350 RepID=UPI003B5295D2